MNQSHMLSLFPRITHHVHLSFMIYAHHVHLSFMIYASNFFGCNWYWHYMTYEVAYRYGGNAGKLDNAGKQGNANNTGMQIVKSGNV